MGPKAGMDSRKTGMDAARDGDSRKAVRLLLPWPRRGDAEVQFKVGPILSFGSTL